LFPRCVNKWSERSPTIPCPSAGRSRERKEPEADGTGLLFFDPSDANSTGTSCRPVGRRVGEEGGEAEEDFCLVSGGEGVVVALRQSIRAPKTPEKKRGQQPFASKAFFSGRGHRHEVVAVCRSRSLSRRSVPDDHVIGSITVISSLSHETNRCRRRSGTGQPSVPHVRGVPGVPRVIGERGRSPSQSLKGRRSVPRTKRWMNSCLGSYERTGKGSNTLNPGREGDRTMRFRRRTSRVTPICDNA